jgi:hypothetical protein
MKVEATCEEDENVCNKTSIRLQEALLQKAVSSVDRAVQLFKYLLFIIISFIFFNFSLKLNKRISQHLFIEGNDIKTNERSIMKIINFLIFLNF